MTQSDSWDAVRTAAACRFRWTRFCTALLCGLVILGVTQQAWAQRYKSLCDKMLPKAERQLLERKVRPAIRNAAPLGAAEEDVKKYFLRYYFVKLTCYKDPKLLGELGKMREDLFKQYIRAARNPATQQLLTQLAFRACKALAIDNYHPAVRYNATLILGNLDSQVATRGNPPKPLAEATEVLLDFLENDKVEGPGGKSLAVHPSVKSGALVGLERHARYGLDPRLVDRFTKSLTAFVNDESRHEEVSREVHHWMKCQAVAALAQRYKNEWNDEAQQLMLKYMNMEEFSLDDRCYVASLMEQIDYTKADGVDFEAAAKALGKLSQDVMAKEDELAEEFEEEMVEAGGGGGGGFRRSAFGRGPSLEETLGYELRRLLSRLRAIEKAGASLANGGSEATNAKIGELLDLMKPIRVEAAEDAPNTLKVAGLVRTAKPAVDRLVSSWGGG